MFDINLLPDSYRRAQRQTPFKMLALAIVIALAVFLAYRVTVNQFRRLPAVQKENRKLQADESALKAKLALTEELAKQLTKYEARIDAVRSLYRGRVIWAKLLLDIKNMVARNQGGPGGLLWFNRLQAAANGAVTINGYSAGADRYSASEGHTGLLKDFDVYRPDLRPEEQELADIEAQRTEIERQNPDPAKRPEAVRRELAELDARQGDLLDVKSGRVSVQPFIKFVKPGSLKPGRFAWTPLSGGDGGDAPTSAYSFDIAFILQPPDGAAED